jgi:hypothetical protein
LDVIQKRYNEIIYKTTKADYEISEIISTVQTEIECWADVAKKNISQGKVLTTKEAVRTDNGRGERLSNMIIYDAPEIEDDDWNEFYRDETLHEVVKFILGATAADGSLSVAHSVY